MPAAWHSGAAQAWQQKSHQGNLVAFFFAVAVLIDEIGLIPMAIVWVDEALRRWQAAGLRPSGPSK
jgi:hypothetical protein